MRDNRPFGAAQRRAVAKFHGLLSNGGNRLQIAQLESLFYREDAGGHWTLPEGTALKIRRLIVPLAVAIVTLHAGQAFAQGAFPAPLPGKAGMANDPAFPPVNGATAVPSFGAAPAAGGFPAAGAAPFASSPFAPAPPTQAGPSDDCMKGFMPLREEAEKRGKLIKAASDRHAPPGRGLQADRKLRPVRGQDDQIRRKPRS